MTAYTITVSGKVYDVEVEKKNSSPALEVGSPASKTAALPPTAAKPAPTTPISAKTENADDKIAAPMPGKIIHVKVSVGDTVKKGQELIIMEAMKMHNPVLAANDGIVKEIYVKAGDAVQSGTLLIAIG